MANRKLIVELVGDSRSLDRAFGRAGKSATGFQSHMKKIAYGAGVVIGGAFLGMAAILKRGFGEFMQGQKVMAQTKAVLHSTGGVANVTAKHVDAMAGALSRTTGIDDEVIGSGENMLLTFTKIHNAVGKGPKVFDMATKAVLDTSVALGRDMPTTAIQIGKALNDTNVNAKGTITGWTALRRVGVMISPMMMKQAAALIKAGKPMKAQLLLLKELNTEFGGSAKAFGSTLPGTFSKFHNAVDEVTGAFAEGLAPVVQRVADILQKKMADPKFVARVREFGRVVGEKLFNAFTSISNWFQAHWGQITGGFRNFITIIRNAWKIAKMLKNVLVTITTPLRIEFKILLMIWDKVLGMMSTAAGIMSHLPFVGDRFKGMQEGIDAARAILKSPFGGGGPASAGVANKGVVVNGDIHVNGVDDPKKLAEKIHHQAKKKSKQTRGRHQPGLYHH